MEVLVKIQQKKYICNHKISAVWTYKSPKNKIYL